MLLIAPSCRAIPDSCRRLGMIATFGLVIDVVVGGGENKQVRSWRTKVSLSRQALPASIVSFTSCQNSGGRQHSLHQCVLFLRHGTSYLVRPPKAGTTTNVRSSASSVCMQTHLHFRSSVSLLRQNCSIAHGCACTVQGIGRALLQ